MKPEILIWGDSFAMHLVPGFLGAANNEPRIVQATRSECGPLLGYAAIGQSSSTKGTWARDCINSTTPWSDTFSTRVRLGLLCCRAFSHNSWTRKRGF